jgi:putative membrane protein
MVPLGLQAQTTRVQENPVRANDDARTAGQRTLTGPEFLQWAAMDGLMETTLAGMVDNQTDDETLEKLADQIDSDHDKANRAIVTLAEKRGVDIPNTLDDRHKKMIDQMGKLEGKAFEQRYLQQALSAHERAVRLFAAEAEHGRDPDVRDFAREQLPILRRHLKMVQDCAAARGIAPGRAEPAPVRTPINSTAPAPETTPAPRQP